MRKGVVSIILFCENSKKTKRCIAERKRSGTNEKRLALFLLLAGADKSQRIEAFREGRFAGLDEPGYRV